MTSRNGASKSTDPRPTPRIPLSVPRVDNEPRRALTSLNLRRHEKGVFDLMHAWWALRAGSALSQQDAFSILLALALRNPDADLPADLAALS